MPTLRGKSTQERMMSRCIRIFAPLLLAVTLAASGCGDVAIEELGSEGFPCYANNSCDKGLECDRGICEYRFIVTGHPDVDVMLATRRVREAVAETGFPIHPGMTPPNVEASYHPVVGEIIASRDARPVGSVIDSPGTCLYNQTQEGLIDYMEYGIDQASGFFITGSNNLFTIYQEGDLAYYFISGRKQGKDLKDVEALLIYKINLLTGNPTPSSIEHEALDWYFSADECE